MEKIKIFNMELDKEGNAGLSGIALVESPAINLNWVAFANDDASKQNNVQFQVHDEDKQMMVGAFLIPDKPIYRKMELQEGKGEEEFFLRMSANTIKQVQERFISLNDNRTLLVNHSEMKADAYLLENWIVEDNKKDKSSFYGFDVPVGTWFGIVKVQDKELWNEIKKERFQGFSIEGSFLFKDEVEGVISQTFKNDNSMSKEKENAKSFDEKKAQFSEHEADGANLFIDGEVAEGTFVWVVTEDGNDFEPAPDGDYTLGNGVSIAVEGGVITSVSEAETTEEVAEPAEVVEAELEKQVEKVEEAVKSEKVDFAAELKKLNESLEAKLVEMTKKVEGLESKIEEASTESVKFKSETKEEGKSSTSMLDRWKENRLRTKLSK